MEKVQLNNVQLDRLANQHPDLSPYFYQTVACNRLPKKPVTHRPCAYIVNTDPDSKPGLHWLGLWTENGVCEVMDSYALPLTTYKTTRPLIRWLKQHWKIKTNQTSLQSIYSQSCGAYALFYLIARAQGKTLDDFLRQFKKHRYVYNDHKVGAMLKTLIKKEMYWDNICKLRHAQDCKRSKSGVRQLMQ